MGTPGSSAFSARDSVTASQKLRAGHDRDADRGQRLALRERHDAPDGIGLEVAVDNHVVVFALEEGRDGQDRHRQRFTRRWRARRVDEDDHATTPLRQPHADTAERGRRRPRERARA